MDDDWKAKLIEKMCALCKPRVQAAQANGPKIHSLCGRCQGIMGEAIMAEALNRTAAEILGSKVGKV